MLVASVDMFACHGQNRAAMLVRLLKTISLTAAFLGAGCGGAGGASQPPPPSTGDTVPPTVPAAVVAEALSESSIGLRWNASTDNVGVTGYRVNRDGNQVATAAGTTYTDSGLGPSSSHTYTVAAFDAAGNRSALSTPVSATTMAKQDTVAPTVPGGLNASALSATSIRVSWNASTDDVGVAGYRLSRNGGEITTVTETSYTDAGLSPATSYSYSVLAFDAAGNRSAASASVTATTMASGGWQASNGVPVQSTTAAKTAHNDQGPRRMARIGNVTIVLADGADNTSISDGIYRSTDDGAHWTLIGKEPSANRGTIVTAPNDTFLAFWVDWRRGGIYMTRWQAGDTSAPAPYPVYTGYVTSVGSDQGYQQITATVDSSGHVFVAWHSAPAAGQVDKIYLIKTMDGGDSWSSPSVVHEQANRTYIMPNITADHGDRLHLVFTDGIDAFLGGQSDANRRVYYVTSGDLGATWTTPVYVDDNANSGAMVANICIMESRQKNLFVFGQRSNATSPTGPVFSRSTDGGSTWSAFGLLDQRNSPGYADPSSAVGSDGTIYVTFRQDRDPSGTLYTCPTGTTPCWTNVVVQSTDEGMSWTRVDTNRVEDRTGPANSMRYQTWWNYGGPLEWTWEQYTAADTSVRPVFYDVNTGVGIFDIQRP